MCGKYLVKRALEGKKVGSPPHVREILYRQLSMEQVHRITPACAGNTLKDPSMTLPAI